MNVVVKWSAKGRALLGLFVPLFTWLAWYSFTSETKPSPGAGYFSIAATIAALALQVHFASYRVTAGPKGISETYAFRRRELAWDDVQQVDGVAQASDGGTLYRWTAAPEDAFHVIVHTRKGRVSVHRWMTGVDELIEALRVHGDATYRQPATSPIARKDPTVKPVVRHSPAVDALSRVNSGMEVMLAMVFVGLVSLVGGLTLASRVPITGNGPVDVALVVLAPWAIAFIVYKMIARERSRRFGVEYARPPLGVKDAVLTMCAALAGPALLYGFVPRAIASREPVELVLVAGGVFLCWVPIAEVRKSLRER